MKTEKEKLHQLKKALVVGEKSGFLKKFHPSKNLKSIHKRLLLNRNSAQKA